MTSSSRAQRAAAILLPVLLALLILGYRLPSTGLWTDESIYAQTAREMARSGDWITPTLCGKPYLIKPVLYHWLAAVLFHLFGETELAGRLPQALAGLVGIAATAGLAGRLFGPRVGLLAGAALATCPGFAMGARVAGMDVLLTTAVCLCLGCFFLGYREPRRRRAWFLASGFWAGIGMLAKGPLGAAVPAMVIGLFLLRRLQPRLLVSAAALQGAAIAVGVAAVWYLPVWIRHGDAFTRVFWLKNNLARIAEPVSQHSGPPHYYLPIFLFAFLPWSFPFCFILIRSLARLFRSRGASVDPAAEFLGIWFAAPFVFYSLIATKLPGYLLPVFPAAAILTAREWERPRPPRRAGAWGFRTACALGAASLPGVALAVPFLLQYRYGIPPGRIALFPAVTFVCAAAAAVSALAVRGKLRSVWWVAAGTVFVLGFVRFAIVPVAPYESMKEMTEHLLQKREAGFSVALAGGHLKGTLFYTNCSVPMPRDLNDLPRPAAGFPFFCLVKDRFRPDLEAWASRSDFKLTTLERRGGLSLVQADR